MVIKKEEKKSFSVKFPVSLIEEIDQLCASNYISRTAWLIKAARHSLDKKRADSTEELLAKLAEKENK